jgi:hypothetical protein
MMRLQLVTLLAAVVAGSAHAAPVEYTPPNETARLPPGPNLGLVQANCMICHSVDYITTQPRTFKDPQAFWTGEILKMKKAYGASIADADVSKISDYLVSTSQGGAR